MTTTVTPPIERGYPKLYGWFQRHGVHDLDVTPLLENRIAVRRWSWRIDVLGFFLTVLVVLAVAGWAHFDVSASPAPAMVGLGLCLLVIMSMTIVGTWYEHAVDRRTASAFGQPLTQVASPGTATLLGHSYVVVVIVYLAGLVVGTVGVVLSDEPLDRLLALQFSTSLALLAGLGTWCVMDLLQRPAIGSDDGSLRADRLLRHLDAHRRLLLLSAAPFLLVLMIRAAGVEERESLSPLFVLYWFIAMIGHLVVQCLTHGSSWRVDR